nr:uncharacterized protein CTRU02_10651 [Colletotrichum truncatum]KAF6786952.1 hypothetical protein CTRU02_10651 [Colletotrichum truncatum]
MKTLTELHFIQAVSAQSGVSFLVAIVVLAAVVKFLGTAKPPLPLPLPPQPPAQLVVGHLPELIRQNEARRWHLRLSEWARQYGPIFGVRTGYIVDYYVNSDLLVKELFDKRSAQTADRPTWIMSSRIMNNDFNVLFLDASHPRWKNQRKVIQQLVTSVPQADRIVPLLEYETLKFLRENVARTDGGLAGERLFRAIERYTYSAFSTAMMGMDIPETDDAVIDFIMGEFVGLFRGVDTFPGSNIIDLVPSLGKLPLWLKPWEKKGRARYRRDLDWAMKRLKVVEDRMDEDAPLKDSFFGSVLQHEELRGVSCREELAILGLSLIVGAADTSRMTTWSFLEAMMMYPDVQAKAKKEIDRVVGDRLPVYADFNRIPYIRMLMKEVWRWRPPVALGHPHITARDTQVGGYHLPKGSRLHINAYAIGHDPARHKDPDRFWPERFKDDETTTMESINSPDPTKRDHFAFGAGRRVCPGYHVAERSFAVAIMRILWSFDVVTAPGAKTPLEFSDYAAALPGNPDSSMPVKLQYRSESRKEAILKAFEEETADRPVKMPLSMGELAVLDPSEYR